MCLYASVFISGQGRTDSEIPTPPSGLKYTIDKMPHEAMMQAVDTASGTSFTLHDGHCLCQYQDWESMHTYLDAIREKFHHQDVRFLLFWSDTEYPNPEQHIFDFILDSVDSKPQEGVIYHIAIDVNRRLTLWVGTNVRLVFKNGKSISGTLQAFSSGDGNGMILNESTKEALYFHEKEIQDVLSVTS